MRHPYGEEQRTEINPLIASAFPTRGNNIATTIKPTALGTEYV